MKVVIDGVIYVPATDVSPTIDHILQAMYEGYMGVGRRWHEEEYPLWVGGVNEDGEGDTFEEFAARITEVATRAKTPKVSPVTETTQKGGEE